MECLPSAPPGHKFKERRDDTSVWKVGLIFGGKISLAPNIFSCFIFSSYITPIYTPNDGNFSVTKHWKMLIP